MDSDQEKVLKVFGRFKKADSTVVSTRAGLGSDYADYLCQELSKEGHLEMLSEEKPRLWRVTEQGEETEQRIREEEAARKAVDWAVLKCAFCRGRGRDPYGVLSRLSNCPVCHGRRTVRVAKPYETCEACAGTGHYFNSRMYCWTCRGKGVVTVSGAPAEQQEAKVSGSTLSRE